MRILGMLLVTLLLPMHLAAAEKLAWPPELQIEMHVQFPPTAFPTRSGKFLVYELRITNSSKQPVPLRRLEVRDGTDPMATPIASFEGAQLDAVLQHFGNPAIGDQMPAAGPDYRSLSAGESAMVYLTISPAHMPDTLVHRLYTAEDHIDGAAATTGKVKLLELGPPLEGGPWRAKAGAAYNDSHHRRQFMVLGGNITLSSRYAIDWKREENGANLRGAADDIRSYLSYENPVLAVAAGRVVAVKDGIVDNRPGHVGAEALDLSLETIAGNLVVLDLGNGQFAFYAHLKPGSLKVKPGQRVKRGEVIGLVGNSGSSFEPHLHFEVTNSALPLRGEGLPYRINRYIDITQGSSIARHGELPVAETLVQFR
jgi:murein DD-endopeptidase MepM/ murein hydrolase activator NlpD